MVRAAKVILSSLYSWVSHAARRATEYVSVQLCNCCWSFCLYQLVEYNIYYRTITIKMGRWLRSLLHYHYIVTLSY